MGLNCNSLELGCDCLGHIKYFDAHVASSAGEPVTIRKAICMHEEDAGLAWKHWDCRTNHAEVRRARRLVISHISTFQNYEYCAYWYLGQVQLLPLTENWESDRSCWESLTPAPVSRSSSMHLLLVRGACSREVLPLESLQCDCVPVVRSGRHAARSDQIDAKLACANAWCLVPMRCADVRVAGRQDGGPGALPSAPLARRAGHCKKGRQKTGHDASDLVHNDAVVLWPLQCWRPSTLPACLTSAARRPGLPLCCALPLRAPLPLPPPCTQTLPHAHTHTYIAALSSPLHLPIPCPQLPVLSVTYPSRLSLSVCLQKPPPAPILTFPSSPPSSPPPRPPPCRPQDGSISYELKLTGILSTSLGPDAMMPPPAPGQDAVPAPKPKYGVTLGEGVAATVHQHFFCARLDPAVDDPWGGKSLVVSEVGAVWCGAAI